MGRRLLAALLDPLAGVAPLVGREVWVLPLVLLVLGSSLSGMAQGLRVQVAPQVIAELAAGGKLASTTEQELREQVVTAGRVRLVLGVARGLLLVPLLVLGATVAVLFGGWLLGAPGAFWRAFAAVAIATLPLALREWLLASCLLRQGELLPVDAARLLPSSLAALLPATTPVARTLLGAVDFFRLWSLLLLGLGFAAASGLPRWKALVAVLVAYLAFVGVWEIGLPGLLPETGR